MKTTLTLPYIAWRADRPRFVPGARERAMGFKGQDLRHPDGRWFTVGEAEIFAAARSTEIKAMRSNAPATAPSTDVASGYVYFLRCGDWLKIGFSGSPNRRVRELATRMPYRITSWTFVPGTQLDERRAHNALADYRINGEWFSYRPEVAEVVIRSATFGRVMLPETRETPAKCLTGDAHNSAQTVIKTAV